VRVWLDLQGTFAQLRKDLRPVKQQLTIVPDPGVPPMHPFGENEEEEMAASNALLQPTAANKRDVVRYPPLPPPPADLTWPRCAMAHADA